MTAPAQDALGRPLNPDTNLPYPSASQAQLELADDLRDRLAAMLAATGEETLTLGEVHGALVEVAVRQHGRTLRDVRSELNANADAIERDALETLAELAAAEHPAQVEVAEVAGSLARVRALRSVVLGAWRS